MTPPFGPPQASFLLAYLLSHLKGGHQHVVAKASTSLYVRKLLLKYDMEIVSTKALLKQHPTHIGLEKPLQLHSDVR